MFGIFKKKSPALLVVRVSGKVLCEFRENELPSEKTPSTQVGADARVSFVDSSGIVHEHVLRSAGGWAHFSVRRQSNRDSIPAVFLARRCSF